MTNSPAGTPDWFGWANARISELVPVASLLEIRRRRRHGQTAGYPLALLVAAAGLSLAAQLAVAKPGLSGGLLSAVPALAFMALAKLVFAQAPATAQVAPARAYTPPQPPCETPPPTPTPATVAPAAPPKAPVQTPERTPGKRTARRPLADTRRRIEELTAREPDLSQVRIAERLGVSRRTIRDALATAQA